MGDATIRTNAKREDGKVDVVLVGAEARDRWGRGGIGGDPADPAVHGR
jgi:hypothetical protein